MFPNSCICCSSKTNILLSLSNKSSHLDNKTLWDYLYSVLGFNVQEYNCTYYICLRCSKALQVAYHFIQMFKQTKSSMEKVETSNNKEQNSILTITLDNDVIQNNQENEILTSTLNHQGFEVNNIINIETQLEIQSDQSIVVMPQHVMPLNIPNNFKVIIQETNKEAVTLDAGPSLFKQDFQCIMCNKLFENKQAFDEHNSQQHKQIVPFKCKLCTYYTCYRESLLKHYKMLHKQNNVQVDLYETKKVSLLKPKNPNFETSYLCLNCDFKSTQQDLIDDHLLEKHFIQQDKELFYKKVYECPLCYRSFNEMKYLRIHYTRYHGNSTKNSSNTNLVKKFACEKCGKLFDLKTGLFLHKRVCEKRNAVNCNFCKLLFNSVSKYEQHLQNKHEVAIKHECEICGKTFTRSEYLTVHRKRHNERYYQCDLCSKNYISNAELRVHKQRIHSKKCLAVKCNICGKLFASSSSLKSHENEQHTKRYFKCLQCDYISYSSLALKVHQYQHTGKPYKCPFCPKEFVFRKDLRQHAVKHHSFSITQEEMAVMFRLSHGYTSRFDAFSQQNNDLEITEITDLELGSELNEFGLTLQDIMQDLFNNELENKLP